MLNRNQYERHVLSASHFDMTLCFGELRYAIGKEISELVARYDEYCEIYLSLK